ncbi:MAG: response regulator [Planctomycetaceae bacterium]|jgi:two-component system, LuxR family, response regulator FixJ|nr:response regulator [Planctomycetaceae bacterium]MBT6486273.1 response regulator [Planctomycetaceae bacterium]MBT6496024.1 response regulator [Planctomycetaceae bacterium]
MTMAGKPTVFVLDDDAAIQEALSILLQMMNLPAEFFSTVSEFREVYDPSRPGCLLLDLRLPGDGFSLLKELSDRNSQLPVIVITGHGDTETEDEVMKLGAIAFLEKPFDTRQLCGSIRQVMDRQRQPDLDGVARIDRREPPDGG